MTQNTIPLPEPATVTVLNEVAYYTADQMHAHAAKVCAERDAEIERLRRALNNAKDALLNSQTYITASHPIGFGKVCKDVNELALGIVRAALKETK